jgi:hypothetical protein
MLLELLARDDLAVALLSNFTYDASKELRHVCKAFARASYLPGLQWQPFHCLDAALQRLRRRYDFDEPWLAPVEQVVRALYAMNEQRIIEFHLPSALFPSMNVLGIHCIAVNNYAAFRDTLVELVSTHPAFQGDDAGPYRFLETNDQWAAFAVIRDLGFRYLVASAMLPQGDPLGYLDWVSTRDVAHMELLIRLCGMREAAARSAAARLQREGHRLQRELRRTEQRVARVARLIRQLS